MLFHEIYGRYYHTVSDILSAAATGQLTREKLYEIVQRDGFAESSLTIPQALTDGRWPLLNEDLTTPLTHVPDMPLTTLQKRWMKTLLQDPRMQLFGLTDAGLEDVEPLYQVDAIVCYDRYADGDPYHSKTYQEIFRTLLTALKEKRKVRIRFRGHLGRRLTWICIPQMMEYSAKDDKFRLQVVDGNHRSTINLARILSCQLLDEDPRVQTMGVPHRNKEVVLELTDERNAMERAMLHFSHLEKETVRLDDNRYRMTLHYDLEDETEILIRILSFGPMVRVVSPDAFVEKIKNRLSKQALLDEKKTSCGLE